MLQRKRLKLARLGFLPKPFLVEDFLHLINGNSLHLCNNCAFLEEGHDF